VKYINIPEQTGGTPSHVPSDWQLRVRYPASYWYPGSHAYATVDPMERPVIV